MLNGLNFHKTGHTDGTVHPDTRTQSVSKETINGNKIILWPPKRSDLIAVLSKLNSPAKRNPELGNGVEAFFTFSRSQFAAYCRIPTKVNLLHVSSYLCKFVPIDNTIKCCKHS